jgi:hypothetical protein
MNMDQNPTSTTHATAEIYSLDRKALGRPKQGIPLLHDITTNSRKPTSEKDFTIV